MATHSSVLAWRIPGTEEPGGLPSMGSHRVGHDWSDLASTKLKIKAWNKDEGRGRCLEWRKHCSRLGGWGTGVWTQWTKFPSSRSFHFRCGGGGAERQLDRREMLSRLSCAPGLPSPGSKISTKNFRHDLATEQKWRLNLAILKDMRFCFTGKQHYIINANWIQGTIINSLGFKKFWTIFYKGVEDYLIFVLQCLPLILKVSFITLVIELFLSLFLNVHFPFQDSSMFL